MELAVFLAPFGIVQYMPNLFYGALLALFGIEITLDWLFHSYRKARAPRGRDVCRCAGPAVMHKIETAHASADTWAIGSARPRAARRASSPPPSLCVSRVRSKVV